MEKRILIPTDFSSNSWSAMKYAVELYKNATCHFYILNVFGYDLDGRIAAEPDIADYKRNEERSKTKLDNFRHKVQGAYSNPKHNFEVVSEFGNLVDTIKDFVDRKDIQLIVMGTKGESDSGKVLYGNNTIHIMENIRDCPVIAVPDVLQLETASEIVFPTSLKTHFKSAELENLKEIARMTHSAIRVLHVTLEKELTKSQKENKELLFSILDGVEYSYHQSYDGDLHYAVNQFVGQRNSSMICFINKKHNVFANIFTKTMAKELGFHSKIPVLALHESRN